MTRSRISSMKNITLLLALSLISTTAFGYNDPLLYKQWAFNDTNDKVPGIGVAKTHKVTAQTYQKEIVVAVIDSGVDYTHPDIDDNMWINEDEIPGNGIDDDGNGYIDDIHGIDLVDSDSDPMDSEGHGTHVAGIIGAEINNEIGIAGVATKAKIMAIRAIPNKGDEKDEHIVKALLYAAENGAKIINCSFSKDESSSIVGETIDRIHAEYDVLVVGAPGNKHVDIDLPENAAYPAYFQNDNLIIVSSVSKQSSPSFFASWGKEMVDIFAPGSIIYSLALNHKYTSMNGTSQAAPQVSGVAAEIWSVFPYLTATQIKSAIMKSAVTGKYMIGKAKTDGRVDMFKALQIAANY